MMYIVICFYMMVVSSSHQYHLQSQNLDFSLQNVVYIVFKIATRLSKV